MDSRHARIHSGKSFTIRKSDHGWKVCRAGALRVVLCTKTHPGNLEFLNSTGPDPLKNPKTTQPEFNVGPFK